MARIVINTAETEWITRPDGVRQTAIYQEGPWVFSQVCIPPQTMLAEHLHPENEHVYVMDGVLWEGDKSFGPGTFLLNEKGSSHSTSTRDEGCTLLVVWCGRIEYCK